MKNTTYLPRHYNLTFDIKNLLLLVTIPKELLPELFEALRPETSFVKELLLKHPVLYQFENLGKPNSVFGFEGQFIFHTETQHEITYSFKLPVTREFSDKHCMFHAGQSCSWCRGSGREFQSVSNTFLQSGMMTLYCITTFLNTKLKKLNSDKRFIVFKQKEVQLVSIEIPPIGMYYISGWVTEDIIDWIDRTYDTDSKIVSTAMHRAYDFLGFQENVPRMFRFSYNSNKWGLDIPGNACGAGTYDGPGFSSWKNTTQEIGGHNIDTAIQQMTFIVGLATINQLLEEYLLDK